MKTKKQIAEEIRAARLAAGKSQLEVVQATGLSRSTIHRAETSGDVNVRTLVKLYEHLEPYLKAAVLSFEDQMP